MKIWLCVIMMVSMAITDTQAENFRDDHVAIFPVSHASFVMTLKDKTIYVDPVGKLTDYQTFPRPDIILVTDIHHDHLAPELIKDLKKETTIVVGPQAAIDQLTDGERLRNGDQKTVDGFTIEAIPMYNTTPDRLKFHEKGRGNGYVITSGNTRVYVSGDTEDIPEMRQLKQIDYALVCMNLPYTMTVDQAASAVLEMKPKIVFPYHYRGKDGFSDVKKFKSLVSKESAISVQLLNWYP